MDHSDHTTKKYLLLKPREVNLLGLFRVLSFADIQECEEFIESDKVKQAIVERRGVIFLSILAQKMLQYIEKPLSLFGSTSETCLNILGNKSNFKMFLKNLLRGKVVMPSKDSASFLSIIGHLDNRVQLDNNLKPGTNKYYASLCAMASKLAYENNKFIQFTVEQTWKMELLGAYSFWDDRYQGDTTQAFMLRDRSTNPDRIVVAFRGTEPFNADDWSTDCDISWSNLQGIKGKIHRGFLEALGLKHDRIWPGSVQGGGRVHAYSTITEELNLHLKIDSKTRFILTGHSLGGALAVLFPVALAMQNETKLLERLEAVYTFGQPRVGDEKFGRFMEEQFNRYGVEYYRFVYSHDIVPRLPFDNSALMYKHFGRCLYINSLYEAKIVEEEPLKNYFNWSSLVAKRVDALWEVVRSFLLPRMFGQDYKECFLQQMFRIVGLLFPGLSAHGLQDYINATRLATY